MKNKGSITIYLSIVLVSVILVVSVVSESGRMNVVQTKSKDYTYMAVESVMAGYAKQIYKDYGILLVWEKESAKDQVKRYIQDNINMADLGGGIKGYNFMASNLVDVKINKQEYVIDNEGEKFIEQIISYMKYAGTINAAESLIRKFNSYSEGDKTETTEKIDVTNIVDNNSDELQKLVKDINKKVADLKDTDELNKKMEAASQKFKVLEKNILSGKNKKHDKNVTNFLKRYRELMTELEIKSGDVDSAIELIKQYDEKKELFLRENGYTTDVGDYLSDNLKKLENVKNKIKENKELAVSNFSDINSENVITVQQSIQYAESIVKDLESLSINQATEEDKKKQSIYQNASALLTKGILSLVIDNMTDISSNAISLSNLPTTLKNKKNSPDILESVKNKAVLSLYSGMKFGNYLEPYDNTGLKYEMEYIIGGQDTDQQNLLKTIEKIAVVRNAINAAYLVTDKEKMGEISLVAEAVAVVTGLPFLEPIVKGVLIEAWSLAEAVSDIKVLLKGKKISMIKNKQNWNTSLENLMGSHKGSNKGENGLDYKTYLELMIMLENSHNCVYRIMDLMQINVQKQYNKEFVISRCFQSLDITVDFRTKPIFTAMPWTISALSENQGAYEYNINCSYSY